MALLAPKLSGNSCVSCLQSRRQPPRLDVGGRLSDRTVARAAKLPKNNSFDADDELDNDLANELAKFRSHEAWERMASHLDLVWKVGRVSSFRPFLQQAMHASLAAVQISLL
eukprot:GHUV01042144.1.p2 GENE.GHUV01042144.1~~GHUV01042144.1.p2  ORF type:complete len:112 (+),score=11.09 GHUV01042144.1:236-571(+)